MEIQRALSNLFSFWRKKNNFYTPDALDMKLIETFSNLFPRPDSIYYHDYDISEKDMLELCHNTNIAFEDPELIKHFVWHNRSGFFGDWTDFPAFAGDIAIVARRECFDFEGDLAFWYFHTSSHGNFPKSVYSLLIEWLMDILMPWEKNIKRNLSSHWEIHYIGYLGIYTNLGGDPFLIIRGHLDYSKTQNAPTSFLHAIYENFLSNGEEIFKHFRIFRRYFSQQQTTLPNVKRLISVKNIKQVIAAIEHSRIEIIELCS